MRGGCLVLLLIITGLWMGGQGAYTWVTNRKQTTLPAADFINSPPDAKWVKLEHARLDLLSIAYSSVLGAGPPNEVYIPVRGPGEADDQQIKVLLSSRDPRFTAFEEVGASSFTPVADGLGSRPPLSAAPAGDPEPLNKRSASSAA